MFHNVKITRQCPPPPRLRERSGLCDPRAQAKYKGGRGGVGRGEVGAGMLGRGGGMGEGG